MLAKFWDFITGAELERLEQKIEEKERQLARNLSRLLDKIESLPTHKKFLIPLRPSSDELNGYIPA